MAGTKTSTRKKPWRSKRYAESLMLAKKAGLLDGRRTVLLRARLPDALVKEAKRKTGARSDAKLIELALAHAAMRDEFAEKLISLRGSIPKDLDLEL